MKIKNRLLGLPVLVMLAVSFFAVQAAMGDEDDPNRDLAVNWLNNPVPVENAEANTEEEMKTYVEKLPGTDIEFKMLPIPGGKFVMGSPEDEEFRFEDEGPQVEVEIEPFWMQEHEVTWEPFEAWVYSMVKDIRKSKNLTPTERDLLADAIAQATPPYDAGAISYNNAGKDGFPASGMTQYAARMYCKWLTASTGRYYRLPTEAEWEYACRAGTTTPFYFGDDPDDLEDYGWFIDNIEEGYEEVMQLKPNAWGLYDMHGNVAEWVMDKYDESYYQKMKEGKVEHPFSLQPADEEYGQVLRGGSCDHFPEDCRSARRLFAEDDWKTQDPQLPQSIWWHTDAPFVGFRVVRPLTTPTEEEAKYYEPDPEVYEFYKMLQGGKE
jgi:formylglycine-generating enzyme required for sulfatase activity